MSSTNIRKRVYMLFSSELKPWKRRMLIIYFIILILYTLYVFTYNSVTNTGGLYVTFSAELSNNGFEYPATVPWYGNPRLPFPYPPLALYIVSAIHFATGIPYLSLVRYIPPIFMALYVITFFKMSEELLKDGRLAVVSTTLLASSPLILGANITSDGIVTSFAWIFAFAAIYFSIRFFKSYRLLTGASVAICWGIVVLSHPQTALLTAMGIFVAWSAFDRSAIGFGYGALIAAGGILIASPWIFIVLSQYGTDPFLNVFSVGVGGGFLSRVIKTTFYYIEPSPRIVVVSMTVTVLATVYRLIQRKYFIPIWFVSAAIFLPSKFAHPAEIMLVVAFLVDGVGSLFDNVSNFDYDLQISQIMAFGLVVLSVTAGGIFLTDTPMTNISVGEDQTRLPVSVTADDQRAAAYVRNETSKDDNFLIISPTNPVTEEWVPYLLHRRLTFPIWGLEWGDPSRMRRNQGIKMRLRQCENVDCTLEIADRYNKSIDYVYYRSDSKEIEGAEGKIIYQNDMVVVYDVSGG